MKISREKLAEIIEKFLPEIKEKYFVQKEEQEEKEPQKEDDPWNLLKEKK